MEKLYKIGDVSKLCNVPVATLRYWEELNLIKPSNVDIYTGYRYYDEENVKKIKQILFLKDLNFSLDEIAKFDYSSFYKKTDEIRKTIGELYKKLEQISSLAVEKGEIVMKKFVNDEQVVGKWQYETSALSKEDYIKGDCYTDDKALYKFLYFLPEGKGYWVFLNWTKGKIYHYQGMTYEYEIYNGKLILTTKYLDTNEVAGCLIYNKVDSKEYTVKDIVYSDNPNYPFVMDEKVLGKWNCHNVVKVEELDTYVPAKESVGYYLKELNFKDDGTIIHTDKYEKSWERTWTSGHIIVECIDFTNDCHYYIKNFDGVDYLFYEWKTGDYNYCQGKVTCYYVFKRAE
ncbi:MAG: MerR family transcriptional regulator [Clostridia bacterium]|nr:MerR family transcriptional regulator [Clostridia bacterium]